jgi:hypothetical protein
LRSKIFLKITRIIEIVEYIFADRIKQTLKQNQMKAIITTVSNMSFLEFFNSKEVYSVKRFDTVRKASNYAKKYSIELFEKLPDGVGQFEYCN